MRNFHHCTPSQILEYFSVKMATVMPTQALRPMMPSFGPIQNNLLIYITTEEQALYFLYKFG
jgi:hypothetical protein